MEAPTRVQLVDRDHLPDELARFRGLRLEGTQIKGEDDDGNTPQLRGLGPILMKVLVELGAAQEVNSGDTDPAVRRLAELLEIQQQVHQHHLDALQQERDNLQEQLDARLGQLSDDLNKLQTKLTQYEEGVEGFMIGDAVGWATDDGDYETGYVVVGYTDNGEIKVKQIETGEVYEAEPDLLEHEDEIDDNEPELFGFEEGELVGLQSEDDQYTYEFDYHVVGPGSEPGTIEVIKIDTGERLEVNPHQLAHEDDVDWEDEPEPEFAVGDEVRLQTPNGYLRTSYVIAEVINPDENGEFKYKIKNNETNEVLPTEYSVANLQKPENINDDQYVVETPPPPASRGWFNRRIREPFYGFFTRTVVRPGRAGVVEEEVTEVRGGRVAGAIGAAALLGAVAGALIWEAIEHKSSVRGVNPYIKRPEVPIIHRPITGLGWEVIPPKGSIPAGETIHFYNGNQGNHAFALANPPGYKWSGHPGDYSLTGPNGATVDHLQWRANGPMSDGTIKQTLSAETKRRLLQAFPNLKAKLGQLFYIDKTGPGHHGWIKHYITYLLPKK